MAIAEAYNNNGDCGNVILSSGDGFPDATNDPGPQHQILPIPKSNYTGSSYDTVNYIYRRFRP
ncbi:hypothetical protein SBF1_3490002 [Candidatus Desulfosporosinus infrequens]|uniref:Uncharacterized protein n=1 Tax=Candidatus Desulfosporosinus infrequens TaxID=2043169 RepID=A0A2U3L315_9FIRM|nr:hypothetical protein SBF1_3490002 [Candidatus Desulfosporosinus infrequens]